MISHMKTYIDGYLFKWLGLSVQKNIEPFEQLLLSVWKKFHLLGRQRFSIQNSKLFSLLNSRGFLYGKGNPLKFSFSWCLRFAWLSHFCHRAPLIVGIYFKGIALQMSRYLSFLSLSLHKNQQTRRQNKTFRSIVKLFPT